MLRYFAPIALALFLIGCEAAEPPSDNFPDDGVTNPDTESSNDDMTPNDDSADTDQSDSKRPLSDKAIPKGDLSRLNDLIRFAPNSFYAQYLYCTDSHWRKKTAGNAKKHGIGRTITYEDAAERCEEFAEIFSQCLSKQGFNISPKGLKRDFGYIKWHHDKYKENYSIQTVAFVNRNVMAQKAVCSFKPNCEVNYIAGYDFETRKYCREQKLIEDSE